MNFGLDRVSCDGFDDCHDKVIVVGVDFIGKRPICGLLSTMGGVLLGATDKDSDSGSSISSSMVTERNSRSWGVMNLQPRPYPTMQLSILFQRFRCVWAGTSSKVLDLVTCPMFCGWSLNSP